MNTHTERKISCDMWVTKHAAKRAVFMGCYISMTAFHESWLSYNILIYDRFQIPHRRHHTFCSARRWSSWLSCFWSVSISRLSMLVFPSLNILCRVMESTLRTTNNLLERLHASFFFYLLVGTETFLKIGSYLPSAIIIGIAMLFTGLNEWVTAGSIWTPEQLGEKATDAAAPSGQGQWTRRRRPVLPALAVIIATHLAGILTFFTITRPFFLSYQTVSDTATANHSIVNILITQGIIAGNVCVCVYCSGDQFAHDRHWARRGCATCYSAESIQFVYRICCHIRYIHPKLLPGSGTCGRIGFSVMLFLKILSFCR